MILDNLGRHQPVNALHPLFAQVFQFLIETDWQQLPDGKHSVPNCEAFAILATDVGRGKTDSPLEVHRKYIDIQLVLDGKELMGWSPLEICSQVKSEYDPEKDIAFYRDLPQTWFAVRPGQFAIFFPDDAHAPLAGTGPIRKVVAKVPLSV